MPQSQPRKLFAESDAAEPSLKPAFADFLIQEHQHRVLPRLELLWDYYRNDMTEGSEAEAAGRTYRLAQERGLPARLTRPPALPSVNQLRRREIVIENDIAWRIHALVDFMFSRPFTLQSLAKDSKRAWLLETFLRQVFDAAGGIAFFQDLALLGSIYGHVDVLLRTDAVRSIDSIHRILSTNNANHPGGSASAPRPQPREPGATSPLPSLGANARGGAASFDMHALESALMRLARLFVLEVIEAPRAIPVLHPADYRKLDAYVLHYRQALNQVDDTGLLGRLRDRVLGRSVDAKRRASVECTEVWTADESRHYLGVQGSRRLVAQAGNAIGRVPVVHIQNLPQPFFYEGLSDVEPLVPLQDELNTRLSDRANRVTFQSFKMYLGKGIEDFLDRPVGPGQMWATDNLDATIEAFGGDAACPSEEAHILEIREAMDKASAVTPVAAGVIRDRVGNLTSENALRVTLMGMLSRTEKKRITYGRGIEQICELILHAADALGVLPNEPHERGVRLDWPNPLPENETDRLQSALMKLKLGVPRGQILAELGYDECPVE
ncbi:MAG: phage portal protein [Phycisphaeraceae bacterium]